MYEVTESSSEYQVTEATTFAPARTSAEPLFWLSGLVSGNQFVDESGNGRHFTITGKDWTGNNFPYKSAATISPPAGDAALIAADINNFLYDSGGDPNEIPVVSFFQNIDYGNIGFCRHIAQIVNVDGAETTEPAVTDVVWYESALTGGDLTIANSYFGVPAESLVDVYISKSGNDSNGGTSWVDAILTFTKAATLMDQTKKLLGKSGDYASADIDLYGEYKALGFVSAVAATTNVFRVRDAGVIKNMILDANNKQFGVRIIVNNNSIERSYFKNFTSQAIQKLGSYTGNVVKNSVFVGPATSNPIIYVSGGIEIDTCLFAGEVNGKILDFQSSAGEKIIKNSKFTATCVGALINFNSAGDITVLGCRFTSESAVNHLCDMNETTNKTFTFKNNYVRLPNAVANILIPLAAANHDLDIQNNTFDIPALLSSQVIAITTQQSCKFNYNIVNNPETFSQITVRYGGQDAGADLHQINYNTFNGASQIYISGMDNAEMIGNKVLNTLETVHNGSLFVNGIVQRAMYNYFREAAFHIAYTYMRTGTAMLCGYNVLVDAAFNYLTDLGSDKSQFFNNTIIRTSRYDALSKEYVGIYIEEWDATGTPTSNCKIWNNIFVLNGETTGADPVHNHHHIYLEQSSCLVGFESDYNVFYTKRTDGKMFRIGGIGGTEYTFSEWQALGYDTHSVLITSEAEMKALFVDYDNGDYRLASGSQAIGAGNDLGTGYDYGLDASTDFGDADETPTIVTKQQTVPWDCGAFIS